MMNPTFIDESAVLAITSHEMEEAVEVIGVTVSSLLVGL
jgi:hypothetical protein